ncbi:hypothetical protein ABZ208_37470 [Streptomyces sp. NPDC006208]|uniref:hypothetical protein n=1 Tax=Streptomyces sp. NPDC006208 TaxID=3156734 RepID=UPI0033B12648
MAKKGIFRRFTETITTPVKKVTTAVVDSVKDAGTAVKKTVARPFTRKLKPAKKPAKKVSPKPRPTPAVAREQLHQKLSDMHWLAKKWDSAAMSKRISKMTDTQVYAALDMSENEIESATRADPSVSTRWAAPDDPNSNILWYHGGETMVG